jgi:hypothetical protein
VVITWSWSSSMMSPDLRKKAAALGKQVLSVALAECMGVGPEDSRVRLAITIRSAVIAAAYNFDRGGRVRLEPRNDGRVPELMVKRLNDTFTHITGRDVPNAAWCVRHPRIRIDLPGNETFVGQT